MDHLYSKRQKILIVDDNPMNIDLLSHTLQKEYAVEMATLGREALAIANGDAPPDLILLDVMMPEMDGYEVCRRLKNNDATHDIPVIFVTTREETRDEAKGLALGAVDYIRKPLTLSIVKARVKNHLSLKLKTDLLTKLASIDGLTNIPNRRSFDEMLDREWHRAAQNHSPISLLMIDADHFKDYNDHYGHGAGDECLKQLSITMGDALKRPEDILSRYGGEEFVALLPKTNLDDAKTTAEHFCDCVNTLNIPHAASPVTDHVTLSIGCASMLPDQTNSYEQLLKSADTNLYKAKEQGRNQVKT